MLDSIGGRKALVSFVVLLVGVGVTLYTGDVPDGLLQLLSIIFGGFIVGNVGEHISGAVVSKAEALAGVSTEANTVATPDVVKVFTDELQIIDSKLKAQADGVDAIQQALTMIIKKYKMDE